MSLENLGFDSNYKTAPFVPSSHCEIPRQLAFNGIYPQNYFSEHGLQGYTLLTRYRRRRQTMYRKKDMWRSTLRESEGGLLGGVEVKGWGELGYKNYWIRSSLLFAIQYHEQQPHSTLNP